MKKIKALFIIDRSVNMATRELDPSSEWVVKREGVATIKYDGTPALIKNGRLYKRWNRKLLKKFRSQWKRNKHDFEWKIHMFADIPDDAIAVEEQPAPISLHFPYWVPVTEDNADTPLREAFNRLSEIEDGTYELIGEKILGNMHDIDGWELRRHGLETVDVKDYSFDGLRELFRGLNSEGIVWHHPDGRMVKLRRSHFNFEWRKDVRDNEEARKTFTP